MILSLRRAIQGRLTVLASTALSLTMGRLRISRGEDG
jgi:hypothetical protein